MTTSVERPRTSWIPDDATFGARLALVRQRMGWGNVKLAAEACGVAVESWRRWERDGRQPHNIQSQVEKIAERTACDFDWLLRGPRRKIAEEPMVRYAPVSPSVTRPTSRPPDNRPSGRGPSAGHGPDRRTVRVARPTPGDGA